MNEKKNSKIFKDRWHQFQEKVNFEGRKDKFSKIIKNKGSHFSKKISNFKEEKKIFFKGLQKSIKVFFLKGEIQIKEKKERKITHLKIVEQ